MGISDKRIHFCCVYHLQTNIEKLWAPFSNELDYITWSLYDHKMHNNSNEIILLFPRWPSKFYEYWANAYICLAKLALFSLVEISCFQLDQQVINMRAFVSIFERFVCLASSSAGVSEVIKSMHVNFEF